MADKAALKKSILDAGVALWPNVTARAIAKEIQTSHTKVLYHFCDIAGLKDAVARHAVETGNSPVIAQLIAVRHPAVARMSDAAAAKHLGLLR